MKIIGFIKAKNEGDIIESICRHTATFCDEILLNYAKSFDNTLEIIKKLILEGLPIRLVDRAQFLYEANAQNVSLDEVHARYVFDFLKADWFIPVDSDEFLFGVDGSNPRSELEKFSESKYYIIPRRNYIYVNRLYDNTKFLPSYYNKYPASAPAHGKALLSKYIWEKTGANFARGLHFLIFPDNTHYSAEKTNLVFRHFPIRSKEQFVLQTTINWIEMKNNVRPFNSGQHIRRMYQYIRTKDCLTDEDLAQLSRTYAYPKLDVEIDDADVDEAYEPLDEILAHENIKLKYTDYSFYKKQENVYCNALTAGLDELIMQARYNFLKMTPGSDKATCIIQRGVDHDDWCMSDVEIEMATGDKGHIHITGYYPNEITGKETGRIYIDGMWIQDFVIDKPLFHITVSTLKNQTVSIEIISDFSFAAEAPDMRTLSFVLNDIYSE
jgi:hypothetical protein